MTRLGPATMAVVGINIGGASVTIRIRTGTRWGAIIRVVLESKKDDSKNCVPTSFIFFANVFLFRWVGMAAEKGAIDELALTFVTK